MKHEIGERVVAILDSDESNKVLNIFGCGEYLGDFKIDDTAMGWMADGMREFYKLIDSDPKYKDMSYLTNPKIRLDNGEIVWGCECWWGKEERLQQYIDRGFKVNIIKKSSIKEDKNE